MENNNEKDIKRCGCGDNWWYLTPEQQKEKRETIAKALSGLEAVELTELDAKISYRKERI